MRQILIDKLNDANVLDRYVSGENSKALSKDCGIGSVTILKFLRTNGINIRDASHANGKYILNENYFSKIDNPNKAYLLGFLFADGYNLTNHRSKSVKLVLKYSDKCVVDFLKEQVETDKPVKIFTSKSRGAGYQYAALEINNTKFSKDLESLGMIQAKSLNVSFPKLDKAFLWDFVRGYFDGDGCISSTKNKKANTLKWSITICCSESFGLSLQKIIKQTIGVESYLYKHGKIHILAISKKDSIKKFCDIMYGGSGFKLQRKYEKFLTFVKGGP